MPGQQQHPVTFEGAVGEDVLPEQPACPMEGAVGGVSGGQLAEQFLHTMIKTRDGDHFSRLRDVDLIMGWRSPPAPNIDLYTHTPIIPQPLLNNNIEYLSLKQCGLSVVIILVAHLLFLNP